MSTSTYRPGYKDLDRYWHEPRSNCCDAGLVYFDQKAKVYAHWSGLESNALDKLHCANCNREVIPKWQP
jgi:hypothetical protein